MQNIGKQKMEINAQKKVSRINKEIYGHFSEHLGRCIYNGIFVGTDSKIPNNKGMRKDAVEALREMGIPVLRWPGGCFADEYHWMDGIGELKNRKKMINTHWGGVTEDNSFGTHEYMELLDQLGAESYISGNLGSGTVREMSEWVEYMTFKGLSPMASLREKNGHKEPYTLDFFGIGNESWGCGGNMLPEYYANEYRRYSTYVRNYSGNRPIYKVACGPSGDDYNWTRVIMDNIAKNASFLLDGISLHYYTIPKNWSEKGSATQFDKNEYYETINKTVYMDELVRRHSKIMDEFDPQKKIGLIVDEWGTWYDVEPGTNPGFLYQQNTMRDAIVAGINLNIFNKHSDRVRMACIAQLANVLQSVILTDGEKMLLTPTYHVFKLYKKHQDSELVESNIENKIINNNGNEIKALYESVSVKDGSLFITLTNASLESDFEIEADIKGGESYSRVSGNIITGCMNAYNTFDRPENIKTENLEGIKIEKGKVTFKIPKCSVISIEIS